MSASNVTEGSNVPDFHKNSSIRMVCKRHASFEENIWPGLGCEIEFVGRIIGVLQGGP